MDLSPVALRAGDLAYYATVRAGLVRCKVTAIDVVRDQLGVQVVWVCAIITAVRHPVYRRGEPIHTLAPYVVPRASVGYRCGIARIRNNWHVIPSGDLRRGERVEIFG